MLQTLINLATNTSFVFLAFIGAYIIYLFQSIDTFNQKILEKCYQIRIKSKKIYSVSRLVPDDFSFKIFYEYKKYYGEYDTFSILQTFSKDLNFMSKSELESLYDIIPYLNVSEYDKKYLKYKSVCLILLVEHALNELNLFNKSKSIVNVFVQKPDIHNKNMFPYGILDSYEWVQNFNKFLRIIDIHFVKKYDYIKDFEEYLNDFELNDKGYDYKRWINNLEQIIQNIQLHVESIENLLISRNYYDLSHRLASLKKILIYIALTCIYGVIIPFIFLSTTLDTTTLDYIFLVLGTTICIITSVTYLCQDMIYPIKYKNKVTYINSLKNEISDIINKHYVEFSIDNISKCKEYQILKKHYKELDELYRKVIIANDKSLKSVDKITNSFKHNDKLFSWSLTNSGGKGLNPFYWLMLVISNKNKILSLLNEYDQNIIIDLNWNNHSKNIMYLKMPEREDDKYILICIIYETIISLYNDHEIYECLLARRGMINLAKKINDKL